MQLKKCRSPHCKNKQVYNLGFENTATVSDGGITSDKLAASAVIASKLATDAVETAKIKDANVTTAKLASATIALFPPVGAILAWAKSITGVPSLPSGWVECNGQTLSDADSPINGQVIPNLNGNANFLYGKSTSGSTKSQDYLPAHTHTIALTYNVGAPYHAGTVQTVEGNASIASAGSTNTGSTTSGTAWAGYSVVWVMRVK